MLEERPGSQWQQLPDCLLLHIFSYLEALDVLRIARVCKAWNRTANDEFLWKKLFHQDWKLDKVMPLAPKKDSWRKEHKRLKYHIPLVETEVLTHHSDQVLHVCFSHNGEMFASSSKDVSITVWNSHYPATVRYNANLTEYGWKYVQYSQFNESDTLLLVSGLYSQWLDGTNGEIFVFSVDGEFTLQSKVLNSPFDIFGSWYNDSYLLSGNWTSPGNASSSSLIVLNNAYQDINTADEPIVAKLCSFRNRYDIPLRRLMVADCRVSEDDMCDTTDDTASPEVGTAIHLKSVKIRNNPLSRNTLVTSSERSSLGSSPLRKSNLTLQSSSAKPDVGVWENQNVDLHGGMEALNLNLALRRHKGEHKDTNSVDGSLILLDDGRKRGDDNLHMDDKTIAALSPLNCCKCRSHSELTHPADTVRQQHCQLHAESTLDDQAKYLIFSTGSQTYASHLIGIKKIKPFCLKDKISPSLTKKLAEQRKRHLTHSSSPNYLDLPSGENTFDNIDHLIDFHGNIIGMALSPDHRYLYVSIRRWPENYVIDDLYDSPPIAEEIDTHVLDLVTLKQVGTILKSHKAYTSKEDCFYIFLDVCNDYVASGSEDNHGYLWDRHYGICLSRFPHTDVVNSVSFNPTDSEMLVTTSDDFTLKIWRSKNRVEEMRASRNTEARS